MRHGGFRPAGFALWAQTFDWELVLLGVALLAVLFIGFWVVLRVRQWQKDEEAARLTPQQQLDGYRALLDQGLLEAQEFEKLKARLETKPPASEPEKGAES
jgi:hypothetical protein